MKDPRLQNDEYATAEYAKLCFIFEKRKLINYAKTTRHQNRATSKLTEVLLITGVNLNEKK